MKLTEIASCCKALSDENRLSIIEMLTKGEKCACCLLETLDVTQPTLSHHMKILVDSGMVKARKEGRWQYYSINCQKFSEFKDFINTISCCRREKNIAPAESKCCCRENQGNSQI